jgi:hypothetical protein
MPQRSPIIFALFLMANVCVMMVALDAARAAPLGHAGVAYFALLSGQLSAVCIWAGLRMKPNWWTRLLPVVSVAAASVAFGFGAVEFELGLTSAPYFAIRAAALIAAMWVLRRSRYWQRWSGIKTQWQFSTAHLFALMTSVAVILVLVRASGLFVDDGWLTGLLLFSSIAFSVASTIIWTVASHWLLRLAGIFLSAICFSVILGLGDQLGSIESTLPVALNHFLIQAIVLVAWFAWGQILPARDSVGEVQT